MNAPRVLLAWVGAFWLCLLISAPASAQGAAEDSCVPANIADDKAQNVFISQVASCVAASDGTHATLPQSATSGREILEWVAAQQAAAADAIQDLAAPLRPALEPLNARYELLVGALVEARTQDEIVAQSTWSFPPNDVPSLPPLEGRELKVDFRRALQSGCQTGSCQQTFATLIRVARAVKLTELTLGALRREANEARYAQATYNSRTWNTYLNEAPVQYIWELFLNSHALSRREPLCTYEQDQQIKNGAEIACRNTGDAAPDWAISFLHPEAMAEYVDGSESADNLKPGIHMEVFGYNSIRYKGDGSLKSVRGVSVGVLYVHRDEVTDVRPALGLRAGKDLAVGVSFADDEVGVFVNATLGDLFRSSQETLGRVFKNVTR